MVSEVSIRDLRNRGGKVLDRVAAGERLTVSRPGGPSPSSGHSLLGAFAPAFCSGDGLEVVAVAHPDSDRA